MHKAFDTEVVPRARMLQFRWQRQGRECRRMMVWERNPLTAGECLRASPEPVAKRTSPSSSVSGGPLPASPVGCRHKCWPGKSLGRSGGRRRSWGDASGASGNVQRIRFEGPRWDTARGTLGVCRSLNSPLEERSSREPVGVTGLVLGKKAQGAPPPCVQTDLNLVEIIAMVRKGRLTDINSAFFRN